MAICIKYMNIIPFDKSFSSHEKSKFWSDKNIVRPRDVFKQSNKKYWFECDKCTHTFSSQLANISSKNNQWCPYCANQKLCENNDCNVCFNNSFSSHEKSKFWSDKNKVHPRHIFKSTDKKYLFECDKCTHSFNSRLADISGKNNQWCPYCANRKLCENNDCNVCFNNSFSSHEKSKFWSDKNIVRPRDVFKQSNKNFWFECDKCAHEFSSSLNSISGKNSWCPYCVNKTEQKLYEYLVTIFPTIQRQFKQDWCKKRNHLPFDFCIPELKIIIELDGPQHFQQISNWSSPEKTLENDNYKQTQANANQYSVVRMIQDDVLRDIYDWKNELLHVIELHKTNNTINNYYLCKKDEYVGHTDLFALIVT